MKFVLVFLLFITGCQAAMLGTATDLDKLKVGMTKDEVVAALGRPSSTAVDGDANEERLIYRKMPAVNAWGPHNYAVILRDGHVVKWGDEAFLNRVPSAKP